MVFSLKAAAAARLRLVSTSNAKSAGPAFLFVTTFGRRNKARALSGIVGLDALSESPYK